MVAVDADGGPPHRRRQVREPGVQAHHLPGTGQHGCHLPHLQEWRHIAIATGGNAFGQGLFGIAAPQHQGQQPLVVKLAAHRHPVPFGPQFLKPAGVGNQHRIRHPRQPTRRRRPQAEHRCVGGGAVAQVRRCQLPAALHGLQCAGDGGGALVGPNSQWLAQAGAVVAGHRCASLSRPQRAFDQALQVQHQVVTLAPEFSPQSTHRPPSGRTEHRGPPLSPSHGQHPPHARVQLRQGRERCFHQPVDARARLVAQHVADHRQRVHHIAHRRCLDDQQLHDWRCVAWRPRQPAFMPRRAVLAPAPGSCAGRCTS